MTDIIEQDALTNTPETDVPPPPEHSHASGSFIANPRMDPTLMQRLLSWVKPDLTPGVHVMRKDADGLRYMFIITSNSYIDREDETITSKALEEYEASCYPADDVFHCDNPLLWWHDDDVVMGEIVAVNYSTPFLIEMAKELDDPIAKILWDYAEQNGDNAGASHRFGYREQDKTADGTYTRIFKQETSFLPDRSLAANGMTYAGVITSMATSQSDKRLNEIFAKATGIQDDVAAKVHGHSSDRAKLLEELRGLTHKAAKPPVEADASADADTEEVPTEETKAPVPADFMAKLERLMAIYELMEQMMSDQDVLYEGAVEMAKSIKALEAQNAALEERHTATKAYETTLEQRINTLEKRFNLTGRSVTEQKGTTPEAIKSVVDAVEQARKDGELQNVPGWGLLKPPPITSK